MAMTNEDIIEQVAKQSGIVVFGAFCKELTDMLNLARIDARTEADAINLNAMRYINGRHNRLVAALNEYIKLLGRELDTVVPIAAVHGWKSSLSQEGINLRARIEALLNGIDSPPSVVTVWVSWDSEQNERPPFIEEIHSSPYISSTRPILINLDNGLISWDLGRDCNAITEIDSDLAALLGVKNGECKAFFIKEAADGGD